jgi:hypothetical protein
MKLNREKGISPQSMTSVNIGKGFNIMKTYKGKFRITTGCGKLVGYACAIEEAEYIAQQGKGRIVQVWCNNKNMYRGYRYY